MDYLRARHQREPWCAIAASLGVSRQAVDGWLTGARRPSRTVLILAGLLARGSGGLEWRWPTELRDLSGESARDGYDVSSPFPAPIAVSLKPVHTFGAYCSHGNQTLRALRKRLVLSRHRQTAQVREV